VWYNKEERGIPFTWRKKVYSMRGRKEILGSVKEGTKTKSRSVGPVATISSVKGVGRTGGRLETGHVDIGHGSRKITTGKSGSSK
jgi:hypothetical protein